MTHDPRNTCTVAVLTIEEQWLVWLADNTNTFQGATTPMWRWGWDCRSGYLYAVLHPLEALGKTPNTTLAYLRAPAQKQLDYSLQQLLYGQWS